jgi:cellobiose-specific phosphotransferase system component IIB
MPADINKVIPSHSLIDLSSHSSGDFGLDDFTLTKILADVILVEYVDVSEDGNCITRNGLYVPTNAITQAWRKGRVILAGPEVKYTQVGDIVVFPNNLGVTVSNLDVDSYGKLKKGVFVNEDRIFGICKQNVNIEK